MKRFTIEPEIIILYFLRLLFWITILYYNSIFAFTAIRLWLCCLSNQTNNIILFYLWRCSHSPNPKPALSQKSQPYPATDTPRTFSTNPPSPTKFKNSKFKAYSPKNQVNTSRNTISNCVNPQPTSETSTDNRATWTNASNLQPKFKAFGQTI